MTDIRNTVTIDRGHYDALIQEHQKLTTMTADRQNEFRRGFLEGIRIAAEEANGVAPYLLNGMSDRYVSIYYTARRDASDLIKVIPYMHCDCCDAGKRTGLASNACENCMNTGLKYPEFARAISTPVMPAPASQGVDMVLVPREPTEAMKDAGHAADADWQGDHHYAHVYKAMIAAAHQPAANEGEKP